MRGPASSFPGGNDARSGALRPPPRRQPRHPPPRWLRRYGARGNYRARGRRRNCGERGRAGSELLVDWGRRAVQRTAGRLLRLGERDRGVASRGDEKAVCGAIWGVICKSSIVETGQETGVVRALSRWSCAATSLAPRVCSSSDGSSSTIVSDDLQICSVSFAARGKTVISRCF